MKKEVKGFYNMHRYIMYIHGMYVYLPYMYLPTKVLGTYLHICMSSGYFVFTALYSSEATVTLSQK
jgi:hypothetical protein